MSTSWLVWRHVCGRRGEKRWATDGARGGCGCCQRAQPQRCRREGQLNWIAPGAQSNQSINAAVPIVPFGAHNCTRFARRRREKLPLCPISPAVAASSLIPPRAPTHSHAPHRNSAVNRADTSLVVVGSPAAWALTSAGRIRHRGSTRSA
ncbi:hypothetical protein OIDMADRAFT_26710 [Oidiodendron maius Zn]|uniref:Uncharacterized protein n=1 Tax=Oidiodendron maius (strain Zn) TaxID=913774 RepID=A0A0C3H7C7_OIDMZ|nr:hypothetical protein OIDMADRAFT_26710 [Oidiodendron maius Zn]